MNDFFAKRLLQKRKRSSSHISFAKIIREEEIKITEESQKEEKSAIINPEELKEKLLNKINNQNNKTNNTTMEKKDEPQDIEVVHFSCLEEFVFWYEGNKNFFNENQQNALNSLIEAKNLSNGGCNCTKQNRKNMANKYFQDFWNNNKKTDLIATLANALKTKKIIFGNFLVYPE
jgi:hypothetical protein